MHISDRIKMPSQLDVSSLSSKTVGFDSNKPTLLIIFIVTEVFFTVSEVAYTVKWQRKKNGYDTRLTPMQSKQAVK